MPRCPSCRSPLTRIEQDGITYFSCANCFGNWINALALVRRARMDAQETAAAIPEGASLTELAQTVEASDTKEALRCPACEKPMQKDRFQQMIPITVDRCTPCGFVWLDAGELTLLRKLYVELMTSDDPEIARRREKVAELNVRLAQRKAAGGAWNEPTGDDPVFDSAVGLLSLFLRLL